MAGTGCLPCNPAPIAVARCAGRNGGNRSSFGGFMQIHNVSHCRFVPRFLTVVAMTCVAALALQSAPSFAQTCNAGQTPSTPTSQFTVHGDGTVTHSTTGLTWKVCSEGQTWSNPGDVATCTGNALGYDYQWALSNAQSHAFAGYNDWRMPSVQELASIVETCRGNPISNTINNVVFPATPSNIFGQPRPTPQRPPRGR